MRYDTITIYNITQDLTKFTKFTKFKKFKKFKKMTIQTSSQAVENVNGKYFMS